jgi:hypothetical protein
VEMLLEKGADISIVDRFPCQRVSWLCIIFLDLWCLFSHALLAESMCFTYTYRE